jgi:hypothetical protein
MMVKMNPIVHFEIPVDDVERAKTFYEKLFGWKITKFDMSDDSYMEGEPYYMIHTTETDDKGMVKKPGSINGGMMKRANPGQVFTNYIAVDSIDKKLKDITSHGGKVCMDKTEIGKDMGWIALFQDPEGNFMGLHEVPKHMRGKE